MFGTSGTRQRSTNWQKRGACRDAPRDLHNPVGREGSPKYDAQAQKAKSVCAACPVTDQCLTFAVEMGEREGIWGGMTPNERRGLR